MTSLLKYIFLFLIISNFVNAEIIKLNNLTYNKPVKKILCEVRLFSGPVQVYYSKKRTNQNGKIYIKKNYFKGVDRLSIKTNFKNVEYDFVSVVDDAEKYVFDLYDVKKNMDGINIEFDNMSISSFEGKKIIERSMIFKNSSNYVFFNHKHGFYLPLKGNNVVLSVYPNSKKYEKGVLVSNGLMPGENKLNITYMLEEGKFSVGEDLPIKSFLIVMDSGLDIESNNTLNRNVKKVSSGENIVYVYSENVTFPIDMKIVDIDIPQKNWLIEVLVSVCLFFIFIFFAWYRRRPVESHSNIVKNLMQRERYGKELGL